MSFLAISAILLVLSLTVMVFGFLMMAGSAHMGKVTEYHKYLNVTTVALLGCVVFAPTTIITAIVRFL